MGDRPNFGGLVVGAPGTGKTSKVDEWVQAFLTTYPTGIAIIHDTQAQFKDLCASFTTTDEYRDAARKAAAARSPMRRAIAITGFESAPIAELALGLGERHNLGRDVVRVPIFLAWDETSVLGESGSTYIGKLDWRIATTRRHLGILTAHNLQRPSSLARGYYEIATEVVIFSITSDDGARDLEQKLGLAKYTLQPLVGAPPFKHVVWRAGQGLVPDGGARRAA